MDAVNLQEVDFEFVKTCNDGRHLRRVITALEKEYFPDLLQAAKRRLVELEPTSVEAIEARHIPISQDELRNVAKELEEWEDSCRDLEGELSRQQDSRDGRGVDSFRRPIRGMPGKHSVEQNLSILTDRERNFIAEREKNKGNEYFRSQDYSTAIKYYTECVKALPESEIAGKALSNRSLCNLKLKLYRKAEKDASAALEILPEHAKALVHRATARQKIGKLLEAKQDLETAVHLHPSPLIEKQLENIKSEICGTDKVAADDVKPDHRPLSRIQIVEDSDDEENECGSISDTKSDDNETGIHQEVFNRIEIIEDSEEEEGAEQSSIQRRKARIIHENRIEVIQELENEKDDDESSRENVSTGAKNASHTFSTIQIVEDRRDDEEVPDANTNIGEDRLVNDGSPEDSDVVEGPANSDAIIISWNDKFEMNPKPSAYEFMNNCAGAPPESLLEYIQAIEESTLQNMFISTIDEGTFDILLTHLPSRLAAISPYRCATLLEAVANSPRFSLLMLMAEDTIKTQVKKALAELESSPEIRKDMCDKLKMSYEAAYE